MSGGAEEPRRGSFLFVIWQSGGGTQPMFGAVRLLTRRGHDVAVLAPRPHAPRVEAAGGRWLPFPDACEFDPTLGRALEDQEAFVTRTLWGEPLARALLGAVEHLAPDVLVVDQQLRSCLSVALETGVPTVVFAHTAHRFHGSGDPEWLEEELALLNATRAAMGREPLPFTGVRLGIDLMRRAELVLVAMPFEFDPWEDSSARVVHAGPLFEEDPAGLTWEDPWDGSRAIPLVVVSLSSQYMHQEALLRRAMEALAELPVRVLVTTGRELHPDEVELPANAVARSYVPHRLVMRDADAVLTHGGMGTIMAAFAAGVPLVCVPLGRDQPGNSATVAQLGAGIALAGDAGVSEIRAAVAEALCSSALRLGARRMRDVTAAYGDGRRAVEELEQLVRQR